MPVPDGTVQLRVTRHAAQQLHVGPLLARGRLQGREQLRRVARRARQEEAHRRPAEGHVSGHPVPKLSVDHDQHSGQTGPRRISPAAQM